MPLDETSKRQVREIKQVEARSGPLNPSEKAVMDRLLQRHNESLPEAQARLDRERREREKLERKRDRLAAVEQRKAAELRGLQSDIDTITDQLVLADERLSGVAKRDVTNKLSKFYTLTARFVDENAMPVPPRAAIRAFAELAMTPYLTRSEPPLRQRLDGKGEK
jgi:hypothetical protein